MTNPSKPSTAAVFSAPRMVIRGGMAEHSHRHIPEETPVALVHDAMTTAVMMATPLDLEDFAVGFSLTEGIVKNLSEIRTIEIVAGEMGIEARAWLNANRSTELTARRRRLAGATGCGLCGIDSLAESVRNIPAVGEGVKISAKNIHRALDALRDGQVIGNRTRAVHAAAWWAKETLTIREDVGRHNALDKLVGALTRAGTGQGSGVMVLTSRVSVEMVQKAATFGAQILIAVSAPTALAVRTAQMAEMSLIAIARDDSFEVFNRPDRIVL